MEFRRIGRWGPKISAVSLGSWLTYGGDVGEEGARNCVHRAYDLGVNFFDTANEYQAGAAETVLGRALRGIPRENIMVGTKVCLPVGGGALESGLSRKHIRGQVDASLRRLDLDYIDLYQCHRYDPETPLDETASMMDDLVSQGKILYWGVSEWTADQIAEVVRLCRDSGLTVPISNQPQYSALWRSVERDVLHRCRELGMGLLAWSPMAMGVLTGKYRPGSAPPTGSRGASVNGWFLDRYLRDGVLDAVEEYRQLCESYGHTAAQVALAWCLSRPGLTSVIVGASRLDQLEENVQAASLEVDRSVLDKVDEILLPVAVK